ESSLASPLGFDADGEPVGLGEAARDEGVSGWAVWSMGEYVARHGLDHVPRALACLHALTQRFSAEFAIRPFLQRHPATTLRALEKWTRDPSAHVRRLVSEGSRPRLPWGLRLQAFVADPSPTFPLLRALQDDPSAYVRRSVANHLNDIAKDHPDLVAAWVREHLADAGPERIALLRHASRTLIKAGHPATLEAWGLGRALHGKASLTLTAAEVCIGGALGLNVQLRSTDSAPQPLVIDYAVHHVRANGERSRKVFKGWKLTLAAGEKRTLACRHSFKPVTTRRLYPGPHRIDLLINGQIVAGREFPLLPA
ncbi:MAG TPA: DNA alkylation repair protein, partial [Opitutaceae bacterium]|nr:DNA alkylation repair protein [Opitutaceae bacterium]